MVEGLTVQGADHSSNWGGGISINAATVVISATIVQDNKTSGGGGIWIEEEGAQPANLKIIDSKVLNNQAGADGGGVHGSPGTLVDIIGSRIAGNSTNEGGGGVGVSGDAGRPIQLTIEDSVFADNQAGPHGGALSVFNGKAGLTNVLIYGNKTMAGPASVLLASDSAVTIMNSTIADNNPQGHQAILISSADLEVTNSIMWNNALNIQTESTDPVKVNYSDVEGECSWCTVGQGNIDKDPRFLDAANDD